MKNGANKIACCRRVRVVTEFITNGTNCKHEEDQGINKLMDTKQLS